MISVVIPLFQKVRHIERCLTSAHQSLLATSTPFEIIIVDDGSTDGSGDVAERWIAAHNEDHRIKVIRQDNAGVSAARNAGWANSRYDLILFLDADDVWTRTHAQEILSLAQDFPEAVLMTTAWSVVNRNGDDVKHVFGVGSNKRGVLPCFFLAMATGPMIVSSSNAAVRKAALEQTGGFPEGVSHGEDKIAWGRLATLGPVAYSPEIGAVWRQDADNRSDTGTPRPAYSFLRFLEHALRSDNVLDAQKRNIEICAQVEGARLAGLISFYDHDTPNEIANIADDDKRKILAARHRALESTDTFSMCPC